MSAIKPVTTGVSRRVGDDERQKVAEILSDHHASGVLQQDEFEDRLGAALTARTTAELGRLLADLPIREAQVPDAEAPSRRLPAVLKHIRRSATRITLIAAGVGALPAAAAIEGSANWEYAPQWMLINSCIGFVVGAAAVRVRRRRQDPEDDV